MSTLTKPLHVRVKETNRDSIRCTGWILYTAEDTLWLNIKSLNNRMIIKSYSQTETLPWSPLAYTNKCVCMYSSPMMYGDLLEKPQIKHCIRKYELLIHPLKYNAFLIHSSLYPCSINLLFIQWNEVTRLFYNYVYWWIFF